MIVRIVRVDKTLPLPEYHTEGAVAFDMYSREDAVVAAGSLARLPSNLIIEAPAGYALFVASRGSTPKKGLSMPHGMGIIDQDHCGPDDEIQILVYNFTDAPIAVKRGERIAQGFFAPIERGQWQETDAIAEKSRGNFGSTG